MKKEELTEVRGVEDGSKTKENEVRNGHEIDSSKEKLIYDERMIDGLEMCVTRIDKRWRTHECKGSERPIRNSRKRSEN